MAFVIKQNSFFRFDKKSGGSSVEELPQKALWCTPEN